MSHEVLKLRLQALVLGALTLVAVSTVLDRSATEQTEDALTQALAVFAVSRGLNGVISVVQGTELALEPLGVGLTLTAGQILDPLNDLIERFSWVMLLCASSLAAQVILQELAISAWFRAAIGVLGVSTIVVLLLPDRSVDGAPDWRRPAKVWLKKALILLLLLRFLAPGVALGTGIVTEAFLDSRKTDAVHDLQYTREELDALRSGDAPVPSAPPRDVDPAADTDPASTTPIGSAGSDPSFWDRLLGRLSLADLQQRLDASTLSPSNLAESLQSRVEAMSATIDRAVEATIQLVAVFLLQAVAIPLAVAIFAVACVRRLTRL